MKRLKQVRNLKNIITLLFILIFIPKNEYANIPLAISNNSEIIQNNKLVYSEKEKREDYFNKNKKRIKRKPFLSLGQIALLSLVSLVIAGLIGGVALIFVQGVALGGGPEYILSLIVILALGIITGLNIWMWRATKRKAKKSQRKIKDNKSAWFVFYAVGVITIAALVGLFMTVTYSFLGDLLLVFLGLLACLFLLKAILKRIEPEKWERNWNGG